MYKRWAVIVTNEEDFIRLIRQDKQDAMKLARDIVRTNNTHLTRLELYSRINHKNYTYEYFDINGNPVKKEKMI